MNIKELGNKKKGDFRMSTIFLAAFLFVMPFDAYFGKTIPFPITITITFSFILAVFLEDLILNKVIYFKPNIIVAFAVYSGILLIRVIPSYGLTYNNELFALMFIMYLVIVSRSYSYRELIVLQYTSIFVLIYFIIINIKYISDFQGIYMGIKDIVDPNYLVTNMVLIMGFYIFLFCRENKKWLKVVYLLILIICLAIIGLIGSRGGLFTIVFLIGMMVLVMPSKKNLKKALIVGAVAAVVALIVAIKFLPDYILNRFTLENMIGGGGSGRTTIWKNYLEYYINGGFVQILFGNGRDILPHIYETLHDRFVYPHNLYVKTLLEGGVVGLILLLGCFFYLLRKTYRQKNGTAFCVICAFMFGALFLDMDNMRVFFVMFAFADLKLSGQEVFYNWRGIIGNKICFIEDKEAKS